MTTIELDADHQYTVEGVHYPSVTQVLQSVGLVNLSNIPEDSLLHAADRGTKVHKACALLLRDELDWTTLDPALEGYVLAMDSFMRQTKFEVLDGMIEERVYDARLGYCGTVDVVGNFDGGYSTVLDFKTGMMGAVRYQLAAYAHGVACGQRAAVKLNRDGSYAMKWFLPETRRHDFAVFQSALTVFNAKKEKQ
jgi:hypothetical protein